MADAPPPYFAYGGMQYSAPSPAYVSQQPAAPRQTAGKITDPYFLSKLQNINDYTITQGNVFWEIVTGGMAKNVYVIADKNRLVPVLNHPKGKQAFAPVFIVDEGDSKCCCRCWCPGSYSFNARVYHAIDQVQAGKTACGCCYSGHSYKADKSQPPVMTLEREGCFQQGCCQSKWLGCVVCGKCCQNDMYVHLGDFSGRPGTTQPESDWFGRSVIPIPTPCCIPTFDLFTKSESSNGSTAFASTEGPCVFAGCKGCLCGDDFIVSSVRGKRGDIAKLHKPAASGCWDTCLQCCTQVDHYELDLKPDQKLTPEQKAVLLANTIHIDYVFFENDPPPVYCVPIDNGVMIIITLFECFCKGCILPCQIYIPIRAQ